MTTPTIKLCFLGHSNVGKSSVLLRFTEDRFLPPEEASATIGVDFKVKFKEFNERRFKITLWDTAGQERFRTLTSAYYRDAHGVILVYDVTNRDTFNQLKTEFGELQNHTEPEVVKLVLGNKIDRDNDRVIGREEGEALASLRGALYAECSAKTSDGLQEAMDQLFASIIARPELWDKVESPTTLNPRARPLSVYSANRKSKRLSHRLSPMPSSVAPALTVGESAMERDGRKSGENGVVNGTSEGMTTWAQQHHERQKQLERERLEREQGGCAC